ncbi:MAG: DUF2203 family protein [Nanoarchaeota archaeon]|nr:DUF2203 family protein [Nanoarchaeota archaeon]
MVLQIPKRYLSLQQANRMLSSVKRSMRKMIRLENALNTLSAIEVVYDDYYDAVTYDVQYDKKFHQLSYQFFHEHEKLFRLGAVVHSVDEGIVYFFSKYEYREILLCWQLGEKSIISWHEIDETFEDRKPLASLLDGARVK